MTDDLDPRERARVRRRDRDARAEARALMRPGMGKVFKQILDAQAKAAREIEGDGRPETGEGAGDRDAPEGDARHRSDEPPRRRPTSA